MRKVIVQAWMTLDAVVQAPGDRDEDRSGGFEHGGWSLPYFEETSMKWVVQNLTETGGFLLGRRTYEMFYPAWSSRTEEDDPGAPFFNETPKYVVSGTLENPEWNNTTVIGPYSADAVRLCLYSHRYAWD